MITSKKLLIVPILFSFSPLAVHANSKPSGQDKPECTASTTIQYSTCSPSSGCSFTFECDLDNATDLAQNLDSVMLSSVTINTPALLQETPGKAKKDWYDKKIPCEISEKSVTCSTFAPIANDFILKGKLDARNLPLTLTVTVVSDVVASDTIECGQYGTTVQRMFDCSQRVTNFAGFGDGLGAFTPFVVGNPDPNWFLVSCSNSDNQQCFWLSPVLKKNNPVLDKDQFDSDQKPMSTYKGKRFLWSGVSTNNGNGYNFFEANGNNPRHSKNPEYDYYKVKKSHKMADLVGPISVSKSDGEFCSDLKDCLNLYRATRHDQSVCETGNTDTPLLWDKNTYKWQMPSYPMVLTLTGGNSAGALLAGVVPVCEIAGPNNDPNATDECNGGVGSGLGFRAVDQVPGFAAGLDGQETHSSMAMNFWSSSISHDSGAWLFNGTVEMKSGRVLAFPVCNSSDENSETAGDCGFRNAVRCVSAQW